LRPSTWRARRCSGSPEHCLGHPHDQVISPTPNVLTRSPRDPGQNSPADEGPITISPDDRDLKSTHRALWASGDYAAIAAELIAELGPELVRACNVQPGDRVLDVATGSGNAAIPAAAAGAVVTASDLTPELFDAGRRIAAEWNVDVEWVEADAEAMPFADNGFDVVMSCVGAMFAPHQRITADELIRVCRPGGTIGMINWTPDGFIGAMFAALTPYSPPPPAGASPPPLWGDENRVRELFGGRVTSLNLRRKTVTIDHCNSPAAFRDYWKQRYGPVIAAYRFNADLPDRTAELNRDFLTFLNQWNRSTEPNQTEYSAEYLLVTAIKR
jgi:ubiquinone/menaquinone biosynthesis C-methylase UbiE